MIIETEHTRLTPENNGLCWKLWEKIERDEELKYSQADKYEIIDDDYVWMFTGKYPSSIEYALTCAMETALRNNHMDEAKDIKGAITAFNLARDEMIAAIGEAS